MDVDIYGSFSFVIVPNLLPENLGTHEILCSVSSRWTGGNNLRVSISRLRVVRQQQTEYGSAYMYYSAPLKLTVSCVIGTWLIFCDSSSARYRQIMEAIHTIVSTAVNHATIPTDHGSYSHNRQTLAG